MMIIVMLNRRAFLGRMGL